MTDIATRRLRAQRLIGKAFASVVDAVRWLGAVQSQDYAGAKWALSQRTGWTADAELDRLFDEGAILRTHVLRPTWHFVLPEDVHWLLALTGPRLRLGLRARHRQLEITEGLADRALDAITRALQGSPPLTRAEIGAVLQSAGISPEGQRLPHLLLAAELDGRIVSGPRRGNQFTYARFEERASGARALDRDEAVAELTLRYFRSHGPAQLQDFVWWSGLSVADARTGITIAGAFLERRSVEGKDYWFAADAELGSGLSSRVHLLPNFDEYTVAYRDRSAVLESGRPIRSEALPAGSVLSNIVTVDGRVRGAWRRTIGRRAVRVEVRPLARLDPAGVEEAAGRLGQFLESRVELAWL